jgi:hypothetical protein
MGAGYAFLPIYHCFLAVVIAVSIGFYKNRMDIAVQECAIANDLAHVVYGNRVDGGEV